MKKSIFNIKKSTFLEGTFIATLAIIVTKIMGMLYVIPFYAMVGVKGSALYSYAYNVYIIFLSISSAGIPVGLSKLIKEYHTLGYYEAKVRAYKLGKRIVCTISFAAFIIIFIFAREIAILILGTLKGGNTIEEVGFVIRCMSISILIIPYLSISKGYLQGHNIINIPSFSQVLEQVIRIMVILIGSYICIYIFHLSLKISVGVAITGAFIGGLIATIYIQRKITKTKEELFPKSKEKDSISNKQIIFQILSYAIPFILIDIATSIYNFVDMVFLSRTMTHLGYSALETEFITSSLATWSGKIGMIVTSIAMGLIVSLIPNMVEACTLKRWDIIEEKFNKSIQIILIICIPMVFGISILSRSIWNVFYGNDYLELGSIVLKFSIFTTLFTNLYMVSTSALQSINKSKNAYKATILGYITNIVLDIPLMFFFQSISLPPFLGAILSSILGYSIAFSSSLYSLKTEHHLRFKETVIILFKVIGSTILMLTVLSLLKERIIYDETSKTSTILYVTFMSIVGACIYFLGIYKTKVLDTILNFDKRKKLTLKKVSHT